VIIKNELYASFLLISLGSMQTLFSLPHVYLPPWTGHMPFVFSHAWMAWFGHTFDVGTAIDFFPAAGMIAAGLLAALVGAHQRVSNRLVEAAICFQTVALGTLIVMDLAVPKVCEMIAYMPR
jgi:CubicO group peptidase (beta-lactamase class C family)